jgi:hypothetical protein
MLKFPPLFVSFPHDMRFPVEATDEEKVHIFGGVQQEFVVDFLTALPMPCGFYNHIPTVIFLT